MAVGRESEAMVYEGTELTDKAAKATASGGDGKRAEKRKGSWAAVKTELQRLHSKALIGLIKDLYGRAGENRSFIEARLASGEEPLMPFKRRIEEALYPDPVRGQSISISAARKAVSDYARARGEPGELLDLMLYYVECGTEMTLDYGDMDEPFYSSLESMFDRAMTQMEGSDVETTTRFLPRAVRIVRRADGLGWGYYDYLADRLYRSFPDEAEE